MFGAKALLALKPFYWDVLKHNLIDLLSTLTFLDLLPALAGGKSRKVLTSLLPDFSPLPGYVVIEG